MRIAVRYAVLIEKTNTGYSAYPPDLPGCVAAADTRAEVQTRSAKPLSFTANCTANTASKSPAHGRPSSFLRTKSLFHTKPYPGQPQLA